MVLLTPTIENITFLSSTVAIEGGFLTFCFCKDTKINSNIHTEMMQISIFYKMYALRLA